MYHPTDLGKTDKHMERYVRNGEMLTETMNYHSTSNRMAKVQNRGITEILVRVWSSEALSLTLVEIQNGTATLELHIFT